MRLLLDTHALIWAVTDPERLASKLRDQLEDPENAVFASAVSAMEIATKVRIGKLPDGQMLANEFEAIVERHAFEGLPISLRHAQLAGTIDISHKDPFDRLLIAQAQIERMHLVSNEALFDQFGVLRLW